VPIVKINGKLTRSLATIRDEKLVSAIKRQIAPAFNANNVHEYEHHIDLTIEAFLDILRTKGPYIDMMPNLSFFSFDTICRLAFSDTMNLMTNQSDVDDVIQGGRTRFQYWHKWFAVPQLEAFLFKNRFSPSSPVPSSLGELARKRVQERLEKGGAGIHDDLLDRVLQAREKDGETFTLPLVAGITVSMIHAGSETTAHSLAQAFWDLLRNPEVYKKLKAEIRAAGLSSPPQLAEVRKIAFVEACLKESSRLHNLAGNPLERTVPPEGATICGTWIPGGTVVCKLSDTVECSCADQ
jgi:cytochrome P450